MNSVNITGRVTKDVVLAKTQNNKSKVNFTVAVTRDREHTDFIFCTAYGKIAEIVSRYVKKGNEVGITGSIETWSVEKNSRFEYGYTVKCDRVEFLSNNQKEQQVQKEEPKKEETYEDFSGVGIDESDLPF